MTWNDAREWIWHVFNDPMRSNPWSLVALALSVAGAAAAMMLLEVLRRKVTGMLRRRTKGDDVSDDKTRAAEAIDEARTHTHESEETADPVTEQITGTARATGQQWPPHGFVPLGVTDDGGRVYAAPIGTPFPDPITDSGVHALPVTSGLGAHRIACEHCGGTGYVTRSTNDLLRESLELVGSGGDMLVKEFYTRLLHAAPDLVPLFPADLTTAATSDRDSGGARQRDRLLGALIALANSYNIDDPGGMNRLDTALGAFGRSHAAFARPDGTTKGASLEEYAAVKSVLFETLAATAGEAWIAEYTAAWSEAYDYAAAAMMHEQHRAGFRYPRAPRS